MKLLLTLALVVLTALAPRAFDAHATPTPNASAAQQPAPAATPAPPQQPTAAVPASPSAQVDALVATVAREGAPGVAVLVVRDGQVVHSKGYGLARLDAKEPVTPQTAFDLASLAKPFTATAVMMLAERGKLSYDDPVTKFFPDAPAYARKVTVRHLLTHTSGLVDVINPIWFKPGYEPTSKELLKLMWGEPSARSAPGERFEYNNSAYVLLALVVERASGQSFSKFMSENIFAPLGMTRTVIWDETRPKVERLAPSYAPGDGSFQKFEYLSDALIYGAKGVVTTAEDLAKWAEAIESGKLVRAETMAQALTPSKLNDGTLAPYGFGWVLGKHNNLDVFGHDGGYLGYRTAFRRYPSARAAVVVLSNNAQIEVGPLARRVAEIYLADRMSAPVAAKVDAAVLKTYAGRYEGDPAVAPNVIINVTLEGGALFIESPLRPGKLKLVAQTPTEFLISETTATVTFARDERGAVTGLLLKTRRANINARRLPDAN
ncbi:MAG TPA: serine hydrolase [Pyrinomonadaceae bacterium]|nr:serine hydrolase [Pyrinomonadaceae bacterium]